MKKQFKDIENLAAAARRERAPVTAVSDRVVARLRALNGVTQTAPSRPLAYLALGSAFAAAVVVLLSFRVYESLNDPLASLFDPTVIAMM